MNQIEIWKDIKGYEGLYQVSSIGRVRSLDRVVDGCHGSNQNIKGIIKHPSLSDTGYFVTTLYKNNLGSKKKIHRLKAIAFIPNPENKPFINHIDGVKTNNEISNLEWCTQKENIQHARNTGLMKESCSGKFGKDHHRSVPVIQLNLDDSFVCEHDGFLCAERSTKIKRANIGKVCQGKRITAGGYKWMYKKDYYGIKNNRI